MKRCLVLRHVGFEDAGTLEPILQQRGFQIRYIDVGIESLDPVTMEDVDLLVVLGGPIGVYEEETYPFLVVETAAIGHRLHQLRPTLGICLGAQLMAKALGANVAPGPVKEIGWAPIELTAAGRASPLRHLDRLHVLHWHGDNFNLPANCENLAATAHCPFQAFRKGPNLLGIQFHIEIDARRIEAWLIGHAVELAKGERDPRMIRQDTARHGRLLQDVAAKVFNGWLDNVDTNIS